MSRRPWLGIDDPSITVREKESKNLATELERQMKKWERTHPKANYEKWFHYRMRFTISLAISLWYDSPIAVREEGWRFACHQNPIRKRRV